MKAHPLKSEGARIERQAMRAHLVRLKRRVQRLGHPPWVVEPVEPGDQSIQPWVGMADVLSTIQAIHTWVLGRQLRYDRRPGGLGRKAKTR